MKGEDEEYCRRPIVVGMYILFAWLVACALGSWAYVIYNWRGLLAFLTFQ